MDRDPDERPTGGPVDPRDDSDPFDAIVAGWRAEGTVPEWPSPPPPGTDKLWFAEPDGGDAPADGRVDLTKHPRPRDDADAGRDGGLTSDLELRGGSGEAGELFVDGTADPEPEPMSEPSPPVHRPGPTAPEDDHFVPPEPPPLPRLGPPAVVGLVLLVLGLVLVSTPTWVGVPPVYGLPLGLLSLASGLGWLVLRLWPSPPDDDGPGGDDDGAVI